MPKGYWIAHVDVHDPKIYDNYRAAVAAPLRDFGGQFIVRGGTQQEEEGKTRARSVIIEFPSYQAALDCYHSDGYQAAKAIRFPVADGDFVIVEGYDGPQP